MNYTINTPLIKDKGQRMDLQNILGDELFVMLNFVLRLKYKLPNI